uniref:Uncharacterized protein n=1 Tax=Calcidiscus leptoporus TaxID=127549 RepID=A0A7S0JDB0_9EUKA
MAGTYHYKITLGDEISAKPFGEMADEMPECSAADMYTLEKQIYDACAEKSGFPTFTYQNSMVTPTVGLWTACIGTAMAGSFGGGGGGGSGEAVGEAAGGAAAAAAPAPEPEPEPEEEEEEEMGFDLFD